MQDLADELRVVLVPEASVAGVVVDAKSQAPIAGARVWTVPKLDAGKRQAIDAIGLSFLEPALGVSVTGADGRFCCAQLPHGERHLLCTVPDHGEVQPLLLQCEAGKQPAEVRLAAPTPLMLRGSSDLRQPPAGSVVRLKRRTNVLSSSSEDYDYGNSFALQRDGSFLATGIVPGTYLVQLLVAGGFRQGPPAKLATDRITIAQDAEAITVSLASGVPGHVRGKVTGNVPPQRLGIVSVERAAASQPRLGYLRYDGPATAVARDGSYDLLEPPGTRTLVLFDLWTGAMLQHGDDVDVEAKSERTADFTVQAATLDLTFGGPGFRAGVGYCLELRPSGANWPRGIGAIFAMSEHYSGMACRPAPGQTTARLYLPPGECELRLFPQGEERQERPTGPRTSARLELSAGETRQLSMQLPAGK